jgi:hypothetical protein
MGGHRMKYKKGKTRFQTGVQKFHSRNTTIEAIKFHFVKDKFNAKNKNLGQIDLTRAMIRLYPRIVNNSLSFLLNIKIYTIYITTVFNTISISGLTG